MAQVSQAQAYQWTQLPRRKHSLGHPDGDRRGAARSHVEDQMPGLCVSDGHAVQVGRVMGRGGVTWCRGEALGRPCPALAFETLVAGTSG